MILIPLIFIWSRAPMQYGSFAKMAILATFVLGIMTISIRFQLPGLESPVIAADNWDEALTLETNEPPKTATRARLREGTRIATSIGRFSRSGRRWIFDQEGPSPQREEVTKAVGVSEPDQSAQSQSTQPAKPTSNSSAAGFAGDTASSRNTASSGDIALSRDTALSGDTGDDDGQASNPPSTSSTGMQLRVLENLALQRVTDALAQDSGDVRWAVTGIVTEFAGENWLLLSTVYRAPSTPDNTQRPATTTSAMVTMPRAGDRAASSPPRATSKQVDGIAVDGGASR